MKQAPTPKSIQMQDSAVAVCPADSTGFATGTKQYESFLFHFEENLKLFDLMTYC